MPKITVPVLHITNTIIEPIIKSVVQELMFITNMNPIKDIIILQRVGKNIQKQYEKNAEALRLETEEHIRVEYSLASDNTVMDISKDTGDFLPIFSNQKLGIDLTPIFANKILSLTITYKSQNYENLLAWLHNFRRLTIWSSYSNIHTVRYELNIPEDVSKYLYDVYTATEAISGYGDTYEAFLEKYFVKGAGYRLNIADTVRKIVVGMMQTNCIGVFSDMPPELPNTSLDLPISDVSFGYTLNFVQPTAVSLRYQLYIHNQTLDVKYLYQYADKLMHADPLSGSLTYTAEIMKKAETLYGIPFPGRVFNETDSWIPTPIPIRHTVDKIIPIQLNLEDLREVINLNDLSQFDYPDWLITEFLENSNNLLILLKWFFNISLYEIGEKTTLVKMIVDSNGNLISTFDLNSRCRHYLVVFKNYRLDAIDFSQLQLNPQLLKKLFELYVPNVNLITIGNGTFVTEDSLLECMSQAQNSFRPFYYYEDDGVYSNKLIANFITKTK